MCTICTVYDIYCILIKKLQIVIKSCLNWSTIAHFWKKETRNDQLSPLVQWLYVVFVLYIFSTLETPYVLI